MKAYIMLILVIIMVFVPINSEVLEIDPSECPTTGVYYTSNSIGYLTPELLTKVLIIGLTVIMIFFTILI